MSLASAKDHIAIIDIGSNAVRLVIYDRLDRAPVRLHNERNLCSLGKDLGVTGKLSPAGVEKALGSIGRFAGLIAAMGIKSVHAVGTAALRDAADGADFIARIKKDFGFNIRIIEGDEEARLSALGVMMNGMTNAWGEGGVIGDYGGGSLELIVVEKHQVKDRISLPIGSHRLLALPDRAARVAAVDAALTGASFLKRYTGRDFYALGGAWRSIAKAHIRQMNHPLQVLDHYTIDARPAREYMTSLSGQKPEALEKSAGFSKKRVQDVVVGALTMERIFEVLKPSRLVFSGTGLREGLLFDALPGKLQREDGLIAACRKMALHLGRTGDLQYYKLLLRWLMPLFPGMQASMLRMLEAACLLSDISWEEHEDYQARHAFERLLVAPFYGIDHAGRAFLALAMFTRYAGKAPDGASSDPAAEIVGQALRVAYLLTGGALSLLAHTQLRLTPKYLTLVLKDKTADLNADILQEAVADLAVMMGKEGSVRIT